MIDQEELNKLQRDARTEHAYWQEAALRYGIMLNAGGAIASMTFLGTAWGTPDSPVKAILVPLGFYLFGMFCSWLAIGGAALEAARKASRGKLSEPPPQWLMTALLNASMMSTAATFGAFLSFTIGSISGLAMLAIS